MALKIKVYVKEFLYCNSPLRNEFQVRPIEESEIKIFENIKYARVLQNLRSSSGVKNQNISVPIIKLNRYYRGAHLSKKFKGHLSTICEDMLDQETHIYKRLKKYLTKTRKGILLIRSDLQILCANEVDTIGFSVFEQFGAVVLNK